MDASDYPDTMEQHGVLTDINWSAFWAFSHGEGDYGWPSGGEIVARSTAASGY